MSILICTIQEKTTNNKNYNISLQTLQKLLYHCLVVFYFNLKMFGHTIQCEKKSKFDIDVTVTYCQWTGRPGSIIGNTAATMRANCEVHIDIGVGIRKEGRNVLCVTPVAFRGATRSWHPGGGGGRPGRKRYHPPLYTCTQWRVFRLTWALPVELPGIEPGLQLGINCSCSLPSTNRC